ncbi:MAG: hypothetical protein R2822_04305 [Spirosomataceae bacterium]
MALFLWCDSRLFFSNLEEASDLFFTPQNAPSVEKLYLKNFTILCTVLLIGLFGSVQAQMPLLLKDINTQVDASSTTSETLGSDPRFLTSHGGLLYFTAKQNGTTTSLWKSAGKPNNTLKITDLSGTAYGLISAGNWLYFVADTPGFGFELWRSDGTSAGTQRLKDIEVGSIGSMPDGLINVNGTLYFVATTLANGSELWKSDGTEAGTMLVKDIIVGNTGGNPNNLTNINGVLYFVADNGINGYELWKTNGTNAGTVMVKDIYPGAASSSPQSLTNVNGVLYFTANNGTNGFELWRSDGTASGTTLVKDIWEGNPNAMPHFLTNMNGTLYFSANDGQRGIELWKSNGTSNGTTIVADIQAGSAGSEPRHLKNIQGMLYFSANDGITGQEPWKSDGTAAGTTTIKNIRAGGEGSHSAPLGFNEIKGIVYFTANDGSSGRELWQSNGTETGTAAVLDLKIGESGSGISNIIPLADTLYFTADDGKKGSEIWKLESCLSLKVTTKDTTICHNGPFSLTRMITNYSSFTNHVWRKGSFDGPIVSNPNAVILDSTKNDFFLVAQMAKGSCMSSAQLIIRTRPISDDIGSVRVWLEGPYKTGTGTMTTRLNEQGLLPGQTPKNPLAVKTSTKQPYTGFPWYYDGNEITSSYTTNATDWILVSLRTEQDNPATTVFKAAAILQNDGLARIKGCPGGLADYTPYYVAIEHRNHIGIVSSSTTFLINGSFFYDLSNQQSYIPPNRPGIGQKQADGRFMMYAGDLQKSSNSNEINASDISIWQRDNGLFGRYLPSDANLDGEINALDRVLWGINNGLFSGIKL